MCIKKIYYNTYADGAQDVTEEVYPCREGRASHAPEVRKYHRMLPYNKDSPSHFLGGLPTPRRSKSPSPGGRRDSPSKHHGHHDRSDRHDRHDRHDHHRRSSRHLDIGLDVPSSPKLKRSLTSPHSPHYVVIDQDQSRFRHLDIPLGPVHIANDLGHRRRSSREVDPSNVHVHRRSSVNPQSYVVVNDHREHRRHDRKRRMSTSEVVPPEAPAAPDIHPATTSRRFAPRRAATVVQSSDTSNATSTGSSPSKHVRWDEKLRMARERHNAEIAKRNAPPEVATESRLKGILKRATTGDWKTKGRDTADTRELRRAVEQMDLSPSRGASVAELDLWDRDRLKARFGSDGEADRERRRRSKVWVAGDRYKYL